MKAIRTTRIQPRSATALRQPRARSLAGAARARRDAQLESLKTRLLRHHVLHAPDMSLIPAIRRAAHEATSLAWLTPFPLLALPTLLDEKVREAMQIAWRQEQIRLQSQELLSLAA